MTAPILRPDEGRGWRDRGACRFVDPELFFPAETKGGPRRRAAEKAFAVCQRCPVQLDCFRWAVESGERWAIAGGFDFAVGRNASGVTRRTP